MRYASQEALRLKHEYIGTEHILLGLIREESGVTPDMLNKVGRDLGKVQAEVENWVLAGAEEVTKCRLPRTQRADKVLNYADKEAQSSGCDFVEAEHILLGLLREPHGVAHCVLVGLGLSVDNVRDEVATILRNRR
ncbi:Clp protease N-terminal domain-containing protein [Posidoniimonas corsicana]